MSCLSDEPFLDHDNFADPTDLDRNGFYSHQIDSTLLLNDFSSFHWSNGFPNLYKHVADDLGVVDCYPSLPGFEEVNSAPDNTPWASPEISSQAYLIGGDEWAFSRTQLGSHPPVDLESMFSSVGSWTGGTSSVASTSPSSPATSVKAKDREHICQECGTRYGKAEQLDFHAKKNSHRSHACKDCGKAYLRRDSYLRHVAKHKASGVRHVCCFCPAGSPKTVFKRKDHLVQHLWNKHGSSPINTFEPSPLKQECLQESQAKVEGDTDSAFSTTTTGSTHQSKKMQKLLWNLGRILGNDHPAVRTIEANPEAQTEELARVFAQLALIQSESLPEETRDQLRDVADL